MTALCLAPGRADGVGSAVLLLHDWGEMSLEQAAEVLDIPLGTVKSRLHYGLAALRRDAQRLGRGPGPRARGSAR